MPHTNSHDATATVTLALNHVPDFASLDPLGVALGVVALIPAAFAARRSLRPLSATGQARVDAGGSSLVERRRELFTHSWLDGGGW